MQMCDHVTTKKEIPPSNHALTAMGTHGTHSCGCGFCVGEKIVTQAHTHHTHTHRPMWVLKPMLITIYSRLKNLLPVY